MEGDLGAIALQCSLALMVEGGYPTPVPFVVDTGAMYSSVGIDRAGDLGIPVPPASAEVLITATSADHQLVKRVRPGRMTVWWTRFRQGDPFVWPLLIVVGIEQTAAQTQPPDQTPYRRQKPLLGLGGVVPDCRWTVVGPRNRICDDGYVIFEDVRPLAEPPAAERSDLPRPA